MFPKTTQKAVDRAVVMGVLAFRSRFEGARFLDGSNTDRDTALAMTKGVTDWLRDAGLDSALLPPERELLALPPLSWPKDLAIAVQFARLEESVGVLLFALGVLDAIPRYDATFDADIVLHRLPFLSDSPFVTREGMAPREEHESMRRAVALRDTAILAKEEQRAGLYWWRAVSESLVRHGKLDRQRLDAILAAGAPSSRALDIPVDERGDFLLFGMRYADLDDDRRAGASAVTEARLRALRWLLSATTWLDVDMSS